ncbi:biotin/lipoate A/B protein ligase family protein [Calothrix sp. UHCC 0171]|uniref:biotin/lipoate A/B protein ligase family protein n=1 Tax=Calothrix sp. UHCC 0171 TaxID=3110245 RepID=UPI002B221123|nr:biotin/lipoate A/B protein ligase family protein [Calothrix sp. UHCC 0171]MEA5571553.1 biotin/lipoate A/B protein ligase family protein [Calothrix sp. UHCC 0171]
MQMAIDKWLLAQHLAGKHPPCLRFYTWMPATISLGFHQNKYPDNWKNLYWQGERVDLVKRPTGGRAVLHQGDLTYMVVTNTLSNNRMQAYRDICEFLIVGWKQLGIYLDYGMAGRGYIHNPNCFGTATSADLVTNEGYKLIGSAQLRKGNVILQHGSMRLRSDSELFSQVFGEGFYSTDVFKNLNFQTLIDILVIAAQTCFDVEFEVQSFSQDEWDTIIATMF